MRTPFLQILNRAVMAVLFQTAIAAAEIRYDVTLVGPYEEPGVGLSRPTGINNNGEVVGYYGSVNFSGFAGFLWSATAGHTSLGQVNGQSTIPGGINASSAIVAFEPGTGSRPVYQYSIGMGYQTVRLSRTPEVYEIPGSRQPRINDAGQISSSYEVVHPGGAILEHAYRFDPVNGVQDLGLLNGNATWANGINNSGSVVGGSRSATDVRQGFLYTDSGGTTALPLREATAINDAGEILGVTDSLQPVLYREGQLIPLGSLTASARAFGLNDAGNVVGYDIGGGPGIHAFVWSESEGALDLNTLIDPASGWYLGSAEDINDRGEIIGVGTFNGQTRTFLITPVPEPGTWALLVLGGVCFCACRSKRSRFI